MFARYSIQWSFPRSLLLVPTGLVADTRGRRPSFLLSLAILLAGTLGYVGPPRSARHRALRCDVDSPRAGLHLLLGRHGGVVGRLALVTPDTILRWQRRRFRESPDPQDTDLTPALRNLDAPVP
jgi:hypothetical protein